MRVRRDTRSIQPHHISYKPPIVRNVYKGEHEILTKLNRMSKNPPSKAFVELIGAWLIGNQGKGIDLDVEGGE